MYDTIPYYGYKVCEVRLKIQLAIIALEKQNRIDAYKQSHFLSLSTLVLSMTLSLFLCHPPSPFILNSLVCICPFVTLSTCPCQNVTALVLHD